MKKLTFVSTLADRFSHFAMFRRLGGIDPSNPMRELRYFDRFLYEEAFQGPWPTREVVQRYVATTEHLHPGTRVNRFSVVRQFCRYLRLFEPQCYVPEQTLPLDRRPSRVAHIYTESEIRAILTAARALAPAGSMRPKTYATLFGLLYSTGLRCGEAFALDLGDLDREQNVLHIRKGKFGKARLVPISPSTGAILEQYIEERTRAAPTAPDLPLFITSTGRRLYHTNVDLAFRQILSRCGLRGGKGCSGPRLHHLRHSYACTRLLTWYREGR